MRPYGVLASFSMFSLISALNPDRFPASLRVKREGWQTAKLSPPTEAFEVPSDFRTQRYLMLIPRNFEVLKSR
jgi:hypothetical protein